MLCDSYLRGRTAAALNNYYKILFVPEQKSLLGRMFEIPDNIKKSEDYNKLQLCIQNRQPVDRELFNKALSVITNEYPPLYDRMMQGWSVEQIQADMLKYADYFNKEWNSLLKKLADTACPGMYSQLNLSRNGLDASLESIHEIILYYIKEMSTDFYCTLKDAVKSYSIFSSIKLTRIEEQQEQVQYYYNSPPSEEHSGGLLRAAMDGLREKYRTVDLFGSPHCAQGKGKDCSDCNLRHKCTRGGLFNHLLR